MYDVAVIGGGMAGAGLACSLASDDIAIALVEEKPARTGSPRDNDARGIALSLSSRKVLDDTGIWPKLGQSACPIERIHVSTKGRYGSVRMSAGMLGLDSLGFVVRAGELGRALYQEISGHDNIDLICPATATGIERGADSVTVRFRQAAGDAALECRLLVIADGAFSNTRELAGIKTRILDYRQAAIVCNVGTSRDHRNTAYERFTPDGLVALLPLQDARSVTVLVAPVEQVDDYLQLDDEAYLKLLQETFGKRLGALSGPGARTSYPLFLQQPDAQTGERTVLLGNAAHTIHPNGAQGFNLVLRDVAELAGCIGTTLRAGGDIGAPQVLNAYGLSRQADQRQVIRFSDLLQRTFNDTGPVKSMLRNSAMLALDASPALKKEFIRRATGLRTTQNRERPAPGAGTGREPAGRRVSGKAEVAATPTHVSPTASLDTEVVVVGGGVIGCSMALLAASGGMDCILVERNTSFATGTPPADARALAVSLASRQILSAIKVWQQLPEQETGLFKRMYVWDENGAGSLHFDSADIGQPTLGYIVPQNVLVSALESILAQHPGITVCAGAEPQSLGSDEKAVRLRLNDGKEVSAKLLIAADGAGSRVRRLAGMDYPLHRYGQSAVAAVVTTAEAHGDTARQRFLTDGPLAFLPMADAHRCGVVWSTTPARADELLAAEKAGFQQALADAFQHTLGAVTDVGIRQGFPLQRAQARHYCADRVVLVGDAAHCVHPLAGMGANLGLLDAASLFQVINEAGMNGRDPGSMAVLKRYERWRKGENYMVMMTLEGLKYLFENQALPIPPLRNAGMGLYDSIQALKNFTMRRATGLAGDLPDIANRG